MKAADLVGALSGEGPFTVFAPTNDGFAKLPEGTVGNLLKPENKEALQSILTYHVVAGKFMAGDVVKAINDNGGDAHEDPKNQPPNQLYQNKGQFAYNQIDSLQSVTER